MTDIRAHASSIVEGNSYMVLATADADGTPWATPVWFAADGLRRFHWVSWPGSRHSLLIEQRPRLALTVFDSTVAPGAGTAFYASAHARQCREDELDDALGVFNDRSVAQGMDAWPRERVMGDARLRVYVAEVDQAWVLDPDADVDQRAPVPD